MQLIEAATGAHIWAERFDRELQDIFAVQDEVTAKIVGALVGRLIQTPVRNRTSSIEAYDLCVRARLLQATSAGSMNGLREGQKLLYKALALDPAFAEAHRWLAFNFWAAWAHCNEPMDEYRPVSVEHAEKAVGNSIPMMPVTNGFWVTFSRTSGVGQMSIVPLRALLRLTLTMRTLLLL